MSTTNKTSTGLVAYVKAQLGRPYWYGTYGQTATEELHKSKRRQYPTYYLWANDYPQQYGQRVHDCSGLIKGYLMSDSANAEPVYNKAYDYSANGLRKACKEKGGIDTMPDEPGVLVFYSGHVGVYIGGGEVIEARGHKYGVIKTKLSARGWKWWGKHPNIDYTGKDKEATKVEITLTVLRKGMKDDPAIKPLQRQLKAMGYKGKDGKALVVDGSYGGNTKYAVEKFQAAHGLDVDGVTGEQTYTALYGATE